MKGFSKESSTMRIAIIALAIALSLPAIALTHQQQGQGPGLSRNLSSSQNARDERSDKDDDDDDDKDRKKDKSKKKLEREQNKHEKKQGDKQQPSERKDDDDDDNDKDDDDDDKDDDEDKDDDDDDKDKDDDEEDKDDDDKKDNDDKEDSDTGATLAEARPEAVSLLPANTSSPVTTLAVNATIETAPVASGGDAADDPAIWVNPKDPSQSTIIGTNKQGGLGVYALDGKQLQYLSDGLMNNVDLRAGFLLGGQEVALVAAGNRADNSIAIYRVNASTRMLENVAARKIVTIPAYGSCLYRSRKSGKLYYFVTSKSGEAEQWELSDNGGGKVNAKSVRRFKVGTQLEGCVADDELGHLYIGEEAVGIWKYGAEPDSGENRVQVDRAGAGGHLVADVEGLTIAYGKDGTGYLIASSQGNNSYVVYRREQNNAYVKSFSITASNGIDGVEDTDGIDVSMANLGPAFPQGVFVAQDGINDKGNQNFKLVPLQFIISAP
jgi:3-phytase